MLNRACQASSGMGASRGQPCVQLSCQSGRPPFARLLIVDLFSRALCSLGYVLDLASEPFAHFAHPWPHTCRVDPKGSGSTFIVHGQACLKSTTKPKCSLEGGGQPPAKLLQLNIKELMGGDWRVRAWLCLASWSSCSLLFTGKDCCS